MNTSNMKNIVVLKDLPSNLVEEAIVFLKENQKLKKPELIDIENKKEKRENTYNVPAEKKSENPKNQADYIINEAQLLISEYISKIESLNKKEDISYKKLKKKYQKLKSFNIFLIITLSISVLINFII